MKFLSRFYIGLIFLILYAPILVVMIFSFNDGGSLSEFTGVSFKWYGELFRDEEALTALKNSLILAICSSLIATVIATFAALGLHHMRNKYIKGAVKSITNVPMMNPDIVTGVSMMLLFVAVAGFLGAKQFFGFGTMLIAHTTFNLPYVILSVSPKIRQIDKFLPEAAQDLGCTPLASFFKVELPCILPGVLSGFIMAFTLSLDDFVISLFNGGDVFKTLPVLIYNYTKKPVKPDIYALFTILVLVILCLLMLSNAVGGKDERKEKKKK